MILDNGLEALDAAEARGRRALYGLRLVAALAALSSTALAVAVEPGVAVIDGKVQQFAGRASVAVYSGETLADGEEITASVVVYLNPVTDRMYIRAVDGAVDGGAPTDAEIEAALPAFDDGAPVFLRLGNVTFSRSGSVVSATIDHVVRPYDVPASTKRVSSGDEQRGASGAYYRFFQRLQINQSAIMSGAGNRLTSYPLPPINGKIGAIRAIIVTAPVGAGGTATLNAEINGTDLTGGVVVVALGDAVAAVKEATAITGGNTFSPGATLDMEATSVTAMTAGEFVYEMDLYEAVG